MRLRKKRHDKIINHSIVLDSHEVAEAMHRLQVRRGRLGIKIPQGCGEEDPVDKLLLVVMGILFATAAVGFMALFVVFCVGLVTWLVPDPVDADVLAVLFLGGVG